MVGVREVARNWLSNVGLTVGCHARSCATFIEISRGGHGVFSRGLNAVVLRRGWWGMERCFFGHRRRRTPALADSSVSFRLIGVDRFDSKKRGKKRSVNVAAYSLDYFATLSLNVLRRRGG